MALWTAELKKALQNRENNAVYYFASTEQSLLREAERATLAALGMDVTRIDGPKPDVGDVMGAAGSISLFGDLRAVLVRELETAAMADADVKDLAELFGDLQSSVLVVTSFYKDKKTAGTKKAKLLFDTAKQYGFAVDIPRPTRVQMIEYVESEAAGLGASYEPGAAEALLNRAGEDRVLLKNETAKLAAMAGYGEITRRSVERYGTASVEANVFDLISLLTMGSRRRVFEKLAELEQLRYEPIAVSAALAGSYVDMLRVRLGAEQRKAYDVVFKEMGYIGNSWRLKKAKENAARYRTADIGACVALLARLDAELKRSALQNKGILLQAAVEGLIQIGETY